jgi:hypothetical protein
LHELPVYTLQLLLMLNLILPEFMLLLILVVHAVVKHVFGLSLTIVIPN